MSPRLLVITLALILPFFSGCGRIGTLLEDNGTHLAYALERGAKELRESKATELVVRYENLDGPAQDYYVELTPSVHESGQRPDIWHSYLVVSGKTSGGTSYHNRFVFVPQRLYLKKDAGGATELVLRKDAEHGWISVVAVR